MTFCVFIISFSILINRVTYSSLMPFSIINNISISVKRFHAKPGAAKIRAGSSSYTLKYVFLKFSNTSDNNNVSL